MLKWERVRPGYYRLLHYENHLDWDIGIVAEVAKGADGNWWMEYLDKQQGWIFNRRCKLLSDVKAVAMKCCKGG